MKGPHRQRWEALVRQRRVLLRELAKQRQWLRDNEAEIRKIDPAFPFAEFAKTHQEPTQ